MSSNEWEEIPGFEGLYWVSAAGQVKSLKALKKPTPLKTGHCYVDLYKENNRKKALVHRLVAQAFLPNPNNYPNVCHKDDNPQNNHVDNLLWGTQSMNIQDMVSKGRNRNKAFKGERNGSAKLRDSDIPAIRKLLQNMNCAEVSKQYGVHRTAISLIKRGVTWTHVV
jgi:hypothetical protein